MEKEGFTTPNAKVRPGGCAGHCSDDVCSVCLSPFQGGRFTSSHSASKRIDKGAAVQTKCNHTFHESCLLSARRWKSECPLCRSALSPVIQQLQWAQPSNLNALPGRDEIIQAANRARNAVRLAIIRRNAAAVAVGAI